MLVRKPNGRYWIEGTYLDVRVRESTRETELARAKQVLSDKLKLIRDRHDAAKAGAPAGGAVGPPAPPADPAPPTDPVPPVGIAAGQGVDRTFWEACDGYLKERGPTQDAWWKRVVKIRDFVGPDFRCRDAGINAFVTMVAEGLGKPTNSESTIKRQILSPIKAVMTWASGEWSGNQGCFPPKYREMAADGENETVVEPHVAESLIERCNERGWWCFAAVLAIGICEGPRRAELFNLVLEDVNRSTGRMTFRDVKDPEKARQASTSTRNRTIKRVHRRTLDALTEYLGRTGRVGRTEGPAFVRDNGEPFPSVEAFGKEMNAMLKELTETLPDRYILHVLRHSFASYEFAVRPNAVYVRERGGWASLSSVERYVHLLGEESRDAVLAFWHESG